MRKCGGSATPSASWWRRELAGFESRLPAKMLRRLVERAPFCPTAASIGREENRKPAKREREAATVATLSRKQRRRLIIYRKKREEKDDGIRATSRSLSFFLAPPVAYSRCRLDDFILSSQRLGRRPTENGLRVQKNARPSGSNN